MMTAHLGAQRGFSLTGTAERMALEADVAEAMVAAQAFHWFATRAALLENRRVVTPGGRLGLGMECAR